MYTIVLFLTTAHWITIHVLRIYIICFEQPTDGSDISV